MMKILHIQTNTRVGRGFRITYATRNGSLLSNFEFGIYYLTTYVQVNHSFLIYLMTYVQEEVVIQS